MMQLIGAQESLLPVNGKAEGEEIPILNSTRQLTLMQPNASYTLYYHTCDL